MNIMVPAMLWSLLFQPNLGVGPLFTGGGLEFRGPATVEAIDVDKRIITVKDKDSRYHIIHASPDMERFDELKVGDTRDFRATVPRICNIQKDEDSSPGSTAENPAQAGCKDRKRDGTPNLLQTRKVIVRLRKSMWLTAELDDGRTMQFVIVATPGTSKFHKGLTDGDRLVITYEISEMRKIGRLQRKTEE